MLLRDISCCSPSQVDDDRQNFGQPEREPEERAQSGIIAGAARAPRGMLEFYADPSSAYHRADFDPNRRTILYCASGGRSALAGESLRQLGYTNVAHLDGGIKAWVASGRDVTRD